METRKYVMSKKRKATKMFHLKQPINYNCSSNIICVMLAICYYNLLIQQIGSESGQMLAKKSIFPTGQWLVYVSKAVDIFLLENASNKIITEAPNISVPSSLRAFRRTPNFRKHLYFSIRAVYMMYARLNFN